MSNCGLLTLLSETGARMQIYYSILDAICGRSAASLSFISFDHAKELSVTHLDINVHIAMPTFSYIVLLKPFELN